jgi:hypothetical protein
LGSLSDNTGLAPRRRRARADAIDQPGRTPGGGVGSADLRPRHEAAAGSAR